MICTKCGSKKNKIVRRSGRRINQIEFVCYKCRNDKRRLKYKTDLNYREIIKNRIKEKYKEDEEYRKQIREYHRKIKEQLREYNKKNYYKYKDKRKIYKAEYYKNNKNILLLRFKEKYENDFNYRKHRINYVIKWRSENKEKCYLYTRINIQKRRISGYLGKLDVNLINEKLKEQEYKCPYCNINIKKNYSIDHILPISRGGSSNIENIDLTCLSCNTKKHTRTKEEYINYLKISNR